MTRAVSYLKASRGQNDMLNMLKLPSSTFHPPIPVSMSESVPAHPTLALSSQHRRTRRRPRHAPR